MKQAFQELCLATLLSVSEDVKKVKNIFKKINEKFKQYIKIQPDCLYCYKGKIEKLELVEYPFSLKKFDKQYNIEIIDDITNIPFSYDAKIDKYRNKVYVYTKINDKLMCYILKKTDLTIIEIK